MACGKPAGDPDAIRAAASAIDAYACSLRRVFEAADEGGVPLARLASWSGDAATSTREQLSSYRQGLVDYGDQLHEYAAQLMDYARQLAKRQKCTVWQILTWVFTVVFVIIEIVMNVFAGGSLLPTMFAMLADLIGTFIESVEIASGLVLDAVVPTVEGAVEGSVEGVLGGVVDSASIGQRVGAWAIEGGKELTNDGLEDFVVKAVASPDSSLKQQYGWSDLFGVVGDVLPLGDIVSAAKRAVPSVRGVKGLTGVDGDPIEVPVDPALPGGSPDIAHTPPPPHLPSEVTGGAPPIVPQLDVPPPEPLSPGSFFSAPWNAGSPVEPELLPPLTPFSSFTQNMPSAGPERFGAATTVEAGGSHGTTLRELLIGLSGERLDSFVGELPARLIGELPRPGQFDPDVPSSSRIVMMDPEDPEPLIRDALLGLPDDELAAFIGRVNPSTRSLLERPSPVVEARATGGLPITRVGEQHVDLDDVERPPATTDTPVGGRTLQGMTNQQAEVVRLVQEGLTNSEIADLLGISPHRAFTRLNSTLTNLGIRRSALGPFAERGSARTRDWWLAEPRPEVDVTSPVPTFTAAQIARLPNLQRQVITLVAEGHLHENIATLMESTVEQTRMLEQVAYRNLGYTVSNLDPNPVHVPGVASLFAPMITDDGRLGRARVQVREQLGTNGSGVLVIQPVTMVATSSAPPDISTLSPRSRQVYQLVLEGFTPEEISSALSLAISTVYRRRADVATAIGRPITSLSPYAPRGGFVPHRGLQVNLAQRADIAVLPELQRTLLPAIGSTLRENASEAEVRQFMSRFAASNGYRSEGDHRVASTLETVAYRNLGLMPRMTVSQARAHLRTLYASFAEAAATPSMEWN